MDKRYEAFCLADEHFYETPDRLTGAAGAASALFPVARRETPAEWVDAWSGDWRRLQPLADRRWPEQGWRIHVSARLDNADRVGTYIWDYCVPRGIPFTFVPGKQLLHLRNSKYASRTISGKLATLYPRDDAMLHTVLRELGGQLAAEEGPYILTDLRRRGGPLHVRYGASPRATASAPTGRWFRRWRDRTARSSRPPGVAPGVRDWFELGGHRFLVMDHLPGRTLNSFFAERHPLLAARPDPAEVASYTRWAVRIHGAVERAVAAVHGRGLEAFGVLPRTDGRRRRGRRPPARTHAPLGLTRPAPAAGAHAAPARA